jgi:hypothetical protein
VARSANQSRAADTGHARAPPRLRYPSTLYNPMAPTRIVIPIHGTFGRGLLLRKPRAPWTHDASLLMSTIEARLAPTRLLLKPFSWSGRNTIRARAQAASDFAAFVRSLHAEYPDTPKDVIAHSHAGNIALYALRDPDVRGKLQSVVFLSTPFLHVRERMPTGSAILEDFFLGLSFPIGMALLWLMWLANTWAEMPHNWLASIPVFLAGVFAAVGWLVLIGTGTLVLSGLQTLLAKGKRLVSDLALPTRIGIPALIVRTPGDEASAVLAAAHFANSLLTRAITALLTPTPRPPRWYRWGVAWGYVWAYIRWFLRTALSQVAVGPIFILAAFPMLVAFGPGAAFYSVTLRLSVEGTPPGEWTVTQLPHWPPQTASPSGLAHAAYQDLRVCEAVANWLTAGYTSLCKLDRDL